MANLIKTFKDGSILEYDRGRIDNWCVYLKRPDMTRYAPSDINYFKKLRNLGDRYGTIQVYEDFVDIYNKTHKNIEEYVLSHITDISLKYNHSLDVDILLTTLYAAMVAEENKAFTKLGKRIKRLGIHQLLIEDMDANKVANFSRGMAWHEIDKLCKQFGF